MARTDSPIHAGSWVEQSGDTYQVTGVDRAGRRFKKQHKNWLHAKGINVWRGSKWLLRGEHRFLIERITN